MKLIGLATLGQDATLRYTQQGDAVAGFSVAYNYGRKDNGGNEPTQWVECSLWGKRAESLAEYLTKGRQFYIELSDVHIETYEGRNGQGVKLVGRVAEIQFTRGKDEGGTQRNSQTQNQGVATQQQRQQSYAEATGGTVRQQPANLADLSDDVPF